MRRRAELDALARRRGGMHATALVLPGVSLLVLVMTLVGCGSLPELDPAPAGPLVTIETRGGECPAGACGETLVLERDGRLHVSAPRPTELGRVPEVHLAALATAIRAADFEALRSRPFTGECPVNFDGQETIFTFASGVGPVRLASCEVEIDRSDPLFVAVRSAVESVGQ